MKKQLSSLIVLIAIGVIIVIILSSQIFITLQPGEKGVLFRKFSGGLDKEHVYNEGFHIISPWNTMHIYDVREQKIEEHMDILDKSGLSINVDVSVRFFPIPAKIGHLHSNFGKRYKDKLVIPELRASVRNVMGHFTAEEIFSTKRKAVEEEIFKLTKKVLASERNNIEMTAMLVKSIKLPEQIKQAIENKLKQEQEALAYKFKLEKEKSEAERKRIAAEGESAANQIINNSLTDKLLRMRGIEATIELSKSNNSKVVIVGSGKDGMPLILGNGK